MSTKACCAAVRHSLFNSESEIASVAKVDGDGVLVKITNASEGLVDRLRTTFPLATVALTEDLMGSSACAHVLFPAEDVQRCTAVSIAQRMLLSRVLSAGSNLFIAMSLFVFVTSVAAGLQRSH
jgi:hypothetical protein